MMNFNKKIGELTLTLIKEYLEKHGWKKESELENTIIYKKEGKKGIEEVYTPIDETLTDYQQAIQLLVKDLSIIENREKLSIVSDMLQPKKDTINISIKSQDTQFGTIAFDDAVSVLEGARKALVASAYGVEHPGQSFGRPYNNDVEEFISSCRLAQTEIGSYIIKIECPTEHTVQTTLAEKPQKIEHFGRKTTKRFIQSLSALKKAIENKNYDDILNPKDEPIISSNLCKALADLEPVDENFNLHISVNWAKGSPITEPEESEIHFKKYHLEEIYNIGEKLEPEKKDLVQEFIGRVSVLKGELQNKKVFGEVILTLITEEGAIKARVNLDRPDYVQASVSHTNNQNIVIKGRLVRESPRVNRLVNHEYFRPLKKGSQDDKQDS